MTQDPWERYPSPTPEEAEQLWRKYPRTADELYHVRMQVHAKDGRKPSALELKTEVAHILNAVDGVLDPQH